MFIKDGRWRGWMRLGNGGDLTDRSRHTCLPNLAYLPFQEGFHHFFRPDEHDPSFTMPQYIRPPILITIVKAVY